MTPPKPSSSSDVFYFLTNQNVSDEINALLYNVKWGASGIGNGATIYYSFPYTDNLNFWNRSYVSDSTSEIYNNFRAFTTQQISAATSALQKWSNVANIQLIEVSTESTTMVGDIRFANTDMLANYYAYAYLPTRNNAMGGDIWFNNIQPATGNNFNVGGNGYQTLLHEIGHAIGLDHPFEGYHTLDNSLNHYMYSLMSYNNSPSNADTGYSSFYPTTPMLLDIQAIQYLYGANWDFNADNTVYVFDSNTTYYEVIWDGGGNDTIQYNGINGGVINLNAGEFSEIGQSITLSNNTTQTKTVGIAYNVKIENAIGSDGDDTIITNNYSNFVDGGLGNDTVELNYSSLEIQSVRHLKSGGYEIITTDEIDTLINIEKFIFTNGFIDIDSLLTNQPSSNTFQLLVNNSESNIIPTIYNGPVNYLELQMLGNATNEVVTGSINNDFINLFAGDDAVNGNAGDDVLDGGTGSNFLTGGEGNDIFFIDGRSGSTTWSTITDFKNEEANLWGWVEGASRLLLIEPSNGTTGFKGATYHYDLNNDNIIDTSITFTGLTLDQLNQTNLTIENNLNLVSFN